jgi:hypothetical protein
MVTSCVLPNVTDDDKEFRVRELSRVTATQKPRKRPELLLRGIARFASTTVKSVFDEPKPPS